MDNRQEPTAALGDASSTRPTPSSQRATPPPWQVIVLVAIHLVLVALVLNRKLDFLFISGNHRLGPGTDFYSYYYAGKNWVAGHGAYGHGPGFGFRYHPAFAASIGAALSRLAPATAFNVWVALHEFALLAVCVFLWFTSSSARHLRLALALLVLFSPWYIEVYMGNSSFLAGTILLFALFTLEKRKPVIATGLLIFSIILKPIGLVFLPYLAIKRHFAIVAATVAIVVFTALPFFLADPRSWQVFATINFRAIPSPGWVVHAGNAGFHGLVADLCARLSGINTAKLASFSELPGFCALLLTALPFLFIGVSAIATWVNRNNTGTILFLWSSTYLLGYKDVWEHSYSLAIFSLIWLWRGGQVAPRIVLAGAVLLAIPTGFCLYDVALPPGPIDPEHHWSNVVSFIHHGTKSIPLLALYLVAVCRCFTQQLPSVELCDGGTSSPGT